MRLRPSIACSIRWLLVMFMAVRSSAVSTFWPLPLLARSISAASTPTVLSSAVPKSTNGAFTRVGTLPSPERMHGARHRLADRVEADAGGVGAFRAEGRVGGEDDARVDGRDGVVVDAHLLAGLRRAGWRSPRRTGDQLLHDLAAGRLHRVEREAELVAAHLEEHRAFAAVDDRASPSGPRCPPASRCGSPRRRGRPAWCRRRDRRCTGRNREREFLPERRPWTLPP